MPGERQADIMKAKTEDRLQKGALHMRAITYSRQGDYLLPDLTVPDGPEVHLGKYAYLRQTYLKEHRYGIYLKSADDRTTEQPSERSTEGGTGADRSADRADESSIGA